jgi:hypothetical protein
VVRPTPIGPRRRTPNPQAPFTSYVESNLTMRMSTHRFYQTDQRLLEENEMHGHSVALHYASYNFAKIHQTLRVTPAMEAGVADHVWSIEEIVGLLA